jgi:hypothetical protein
MDKKQAAVEMEDDDEEMDDEDELMDASDMEDEEEDDEEMDKEKYKDLPPAFLKNIKKNKAKSKADSMQARIDHLEGQLAVAAQLLARVDMDDEEDDEESMDSLVNAAIAERLDELFTAFDDAQPYLPSDFKLDGSMTGADVKLAAILNFNPDLKLDSV